MIVGAKVCLDNVVFTNIFNMNKIKGFFKTFDFEIKYVEICQCIDLPDFKINLVFYHEVFFNVMH